MNKTNLGLPLGALLGFHLSSRYPISGPDRLALLLAFTTLAGVLWQGGLSGVSRSPKRSRHASRLQALGVVACCLLAAFAYWLLPEYAKPLYAPVWQLCREYGGVLAVLAALYLRLRPVADDDGFVQVARSILQGAMQPGASAFLAGFLVRLFFAPLMVAFWFNTLADLDRAWAAFDQANVYRWAALLTAGVYFLDVAVA